MLYFRPLSGVLFFNSVNLKDCLMLKYFRPLSGFLFSNKKANAEYISVSQYISVPYRGFYFLILFVVILTTSLI